MKIYIGNLPFSSTEDQIKELFEPFGAVNSVHLINDRHTGRSRGFGFVEIINEEKAATAIETLNGSEFNGRILMVNKAKPRGDSGSRGGGAWKNNL